MCGFSDTDIDPKFNHATFDVSLQADNTIVSEYLHYFVNSFRASL